MNVPDADSSYQEIAAVLTPTAVSQFLAANYPWELEDRVDQVKEIWTRPAVGTTPRARVMLPLATDYVDYAQRLADALRAIAIVNDWTTVEVERHILATHADLFYVQLDQVQADDTIPLGQAETTIDALYEMVKAAAITAAAPHRGQRGGRLPGVVSAFLEDNVRLGHTKRGSFVFTVVTRLDPPSQEPHEPPSPSHTDADAMPAFPRRVMETLARGLETTRDLAVRKQPVSAEAAAHSGMSAGLLESLEDIVRPEGLRSLELSFEWAVAAARPTVGLEPIRLEHAHVSELARVREEFLREEEPPHRETLFGIVRELTREDESLDADAGAVVISAEVNGRRRNVHMVLYGEDHSRAITSYQQQLPLIVTGDLVFERRAWRMVGDIDVDASLIERHAGG